MLTCLTPHYLLDDRFSGRGLACLLRDARTREEAVQWELARRSELANLDRLGAFGPALSTSALIDTNVAGSMGVPRNLPGLVEAPDAGTAASIAAAESELRAHFDVLERVWNERTSAGRPPDLNHDASDYDMDAIDRIHLSSRTPDPVHSSSRQAEMSTLRSATESSRAVTAVLTGVGSSSEPGVASDSSFEPGIVSDGLRARPASTITANRPQVLSVSRRRNSMQPRGPDLNFVAPADPMEPRGPSLNVGVPVTRLSLLHDINELDPELWQDLIDNAEEVWSNDWEHEQPE